MSPGFALPPTVSAEAARTIESIVRARRNLPMFECPASLADWDRRNELSSQLIAPIHQALAQRLGVTTSNDVFGGVPVLRLRPRNHRPGARVLVYLHGGGYVLFSAATVLAVPALMSSATGLEVLSVDYTLAPRADWRTITGQVLAVWRALCEGGADARACAIVGDSAGGGLAAGSVLRMRDEGLRLPGALALMSPWSDLAEGGDTYATLAAADPGLDAQTLSWAAAAYADAADHRHPYVSPVYGDFSLPFPPTLIQAGTREIFLSHAVRLYQAIRGGRHEAVLDVYEGMPHVHQGLVPDASESRTAIARAAEFLDAHLAPADGHRTFQESGLARSAESR